MAIKKSNLYPSLRASCDQLRGGMDARLYKDYVVFNPFVKSDCPTQIFDTIAAGNPRKVHTAHIENAGAVWN